MGMLQRIKNLIKLKNCNWRQLRINLFYLMDVDLRTHEFDTIYKIKDEVIEECVMESEEYRQRLINLRVLDAKDTIRMLENYPKSFSRFGDGEIHIIQGKDQEFQKYDPKLAQKMLDILAQKREDMYVGLNHAYFQTPLNFAERNRKFYRVYGTEYRRFFAEHCNVDSLYLDASCFGAYFRFGNDYDYESHYARIKRLFAGKKVAIVSGEGVVEKLEFDVFEEAADKIIVHGPRINAFSEYDSLLEKVEREVSKDYMICLILGMTATVMVADLTDMGYLAWDVGHIAKDYDAYMKRMEKSQKNMDAFWAPD